VNTLGGVSEREFHQVLDCVDECVLAAFEERVARLSWALVNAAAHKQGWLDRVRAGLMALLVFMDDEPRWARILILQPPMTAAAISECRHRALDALAQALRHDTRESTGRHGSLAPSPQLTAELIVGGVFSVLRARMLEGRGEPFVELAPALMPLVVAPYQSRDGRLEPPAVRAGCDETSYPRDRLPVRATYRTTRVLSAIGASPRLSNREIAEAAGLNDEGQTSKLLRRLEHRGLVENVGLGQTYGGPNAWLLTAYGERTLDATRHSLVPGAGAVMSGRVRGAA
jgi:hypothetical protein